MTKDRDVTDGGDGRDRPRGPWTHRVKFSNDGANGPFAYTPGVVLVIAGDEVIGIAKMLPGNDRITREAAFGPYSRLVDVSDPVTLALELRSQGIIAQPDHVFFAHCDPCCPPHPAEGCGFGPPGANPVHATPVHATPVHATPVHATPVHATPVYGNPVHATTAAPGRATGVRMSSAQPAPIGIDTTGIIRDVGMEPGPGAPRIVVLDTGLAGTQGPSVLMPGVTHASGTDVDAPDEDGNNLLDFAAGHGTFIGGLVEQVAPGCEVVVYRVLSTMGDGSEQNIIQCLNSLNLPDPEHTILNLSFGGTVLEQAFAFGWAIRKVQALGVVVVASAGNDGSCVPSFPAAFPGVVSVGAVGPNGPARFSNYGPWVRACAPGVDLLSTFFEGFNGSQAPDGSGADPDDFQGWALWSGTSFSAPVVAGALARTMMAERCTAKEAVERVIDPPSLMRIPSLGTVINVL